MSQNNPFNLMMQHCRLSIREAAIFHRVDVKQIGHWQSGRRVAPPGVISAGKLEDFVDFVLAGRKNAPI